MKSQSKLLHLLSGLDRKSAEESKDRSIKRSVLLAKVLELMKSLESETENFGKKRIIPPQLCILEAVICSDFNQNIEPNRRSSEAEPSSAIIKPVLPSRWDCKFSGDG